ncbi:MAG: hypothetical protein J6Q73_03505 [Bacteroidaceae bacterium]|nr:hypothetical protein [Bacteroidaceae bacterium]
MNCFLGSVNNLCTNSRWHFLHIPYNPSKNLVCNFLVLLKTVQARQCNQQLPRAMNVDRVGLVIVILGAVLFEEFFRYIVGANYA